VAGGGGQEHNNPDDVSLWSQRGMRGKGRWG